MAHWEANIASGNACGQVTKPSGTYAVALHYQRHGRMTRDIFNKGAINPADEPVDAFVAEMRDMVQRKHGLSNMPLEAFAAISIMRSCLRKTHVEQSDKPELNLPGRVERVASFVLARSLKDIEELKLDQTRLPEDRSRATNRLSAHGIGSARRVGLTQTLTLRHVIHLPVTLPERLASKEVPALGIPTLPADEFGRGPWAVLHQRQLHPREVDMTEENAFIERIVLRDEL